MNRTREIAKPGAGTGSYRYRLFRDTTEHIVLAFREGFYLEAVTLVESLLCERFESRLNYYKSDDQGFHNLGEVLSRLRKVEKQDNFLALIEGAQAWKNSRNQVLHEIAKTDQGDRRRFWIKHQQSRSVVAEGASLLLRFHKADAKSRRQSNKIPATYPDAFAPLAEILQASVNDAAYPGPDGRNPTPGTQTPT